MNSNLLMIYTTFFHDTFLAHWHEQSNDRMLVASREIGILYGCFWWAHSILSSAQSTAFWLLSLCCVSVLLISVAAVCLHALKSAQWWIEGNSRTSEDDRKTFWLKGFNFQEEQNTLLAKFGTVLDNDKFSISRAISKGKQRIVRHLRWAICVDLRWLLTTEAQFEFPSKLCTC